MKHSKTVIVVTGMALLLSLGYGSAGAAFAENAAAQSAAKPAVQAEFERIASSTPEAATAKKEQALKKFKTLLDQQQKALNEKLQPGEIRYVYINDKEYHSSPYSSLFSGTSYSLRYNTYNEYVEKYAAVNTSMPLQLPEPPESYKFFMARIAPYLTVKEQAKLDNQVIAEGKASGKKIYVKKLQEKRTSIVLIYNMPSPVNGKKGVLSITAEPAGPKDTTVESEPILKESEKLQISGQEVSYAANDKMQHKLVAWMNKQTRVNYIIREDQGHLTKEALLDVAKQIIEASTAAKS